MTSDKPRRCGWCNASPCWINVDGGMCTLCGHDPNKPRPNKENKNALAI